MILAIAKSCWPSCHIHGRQFCHLSFYFRS